MTYDLAIIGGGPAGAAAAVYAARKRLKSVFITKDWLGQSNVSEKIENWVGTVAISGLDLSKSLEQHAKAYADGIIDFKENEGCIAIIKNSSVKNSGEKTAASFTIKTDKGSYETHAVIVTSGSRRRQLDVPGAKEYEHKGLTYCATCDGPLYSDQDVAVIGGGNAGFESAAQLLAYCKSVTVLVRSDIKADPGTVAAVMKNPKAKVITNAIPKKVKGSQFVTSLIYTTSDTNSPKTEDSQTSKDIEIPVTGIFVEIGSLPNTDFLKGLVELDKFNHVKVDARNQRASVDGIWAAGDCTDGLYHQNNIAAGDAVKAIEDIYSYLHAQK